MIISRNGNTFSRPGLREDWIQRWKTMNLLIIRDVFNEVGIYIYIYACRFMSTIGWMTRGLYVFLFVFILIWVFIRISFFLNQNIWINTYAYIYILLRPHSLPIRVSIGCLCDLTISLKSTLITSGIYEIGYFEPWYNDTWLFGSDKYYDQLFVAGNTITGFMLYGSYSSMYAQPMVINISTVTEHLLYHICKFSVNLSNWYNALTLQTVVGTRCNYIDLRMGIYGITTNK